MKSFSSIIGNPLQLSLEDMFRGTDYRADRDGHRLGEGYMRTEELMKDGKARGPDEIASGSQNRLDSALRYVRYMKKRGYTIEKIYKESGKYLYQAHRIVQVDSLLSQK